MRGEWRGQVGEERRETGEERGERRKEREERRGEKRREREEISERRVERTGGRREMRGKRREQKRERREDDHGPKFPDWCRAWGVSIFAMYVACVCIRVRRSYQVFSRLYCIRPQTGITLEAPNNPRPPALPSPLPRRRWLPQLRTLLGGPVTYNWLHDCH